MTSFATFFLCVALLLITAPTKDPAPLLFEDFSYANKSELKNNG